MENRHCEKESIHLPGLRAIRSGDAAIANRTKGNDAMSTMQKIHQELIDGKGRCSVPMWMGGLPAGFCDADAFGKRPAGEGMRRSDGSIMRFDGKYSRYIPGLACPSHGGPELKEVAHEGDPCVHCNTPHDEVGVGPCPAL